MLAAEQQWSNKIGKLAKSEKADEKINASALLHYAKTLPPMPIPREIQNWSKFQTFFAISAFDFVTNC